MDKLEYGKQNAAVTLLQLVDEHDLETIDREIALIQENTKTDFRLIACRVDNWNHDLSPWKAPAVFGKEDFGDGAADTMREIMELCREKDGIYYIGGYSLAGLFALWTAYQTDLFRGVAAASPSVWFPEFIDFMKAGEIKSRNIYLSLGDKEEKTRNPVMATVGDRIQEAYTLLKDQGANCVLEWNEGNHFKDADRRTARAFSWVMQQDI